MRVTLIVLFAVFIGIASYLIWQYIMYSEKKILITGEILNYNFENPLMPTEVVLGVDKGDFGSFEEHSVYYVFKIQNDGKFNIKDVSGKQPTIYYRSIEFEYRVSFETVKSKTHIIIEDVFALKRNNRYFEDEKSLKYFKMY